MAQWKETLEPYVKVIESVKSAALNPTAGTDLIVGAVIVSDAGPTTPTLITSQKSFLATYASSDLTKEYTDSLDTLYSGASNMWLNAYRLSGSGNLLITRAGKCDGIIYTKELSGDNSKKATDFIIKDSEILKSVNEFKFVIDSSENDGVNPSVADKTIQSSSDWDTITNAYAGMKVWVSNSHTMYKVVSVSSKVMDKEHELYTFTQADAAATIASNTSENLATISTPNVGMKVWVTNESKLYKVTTVSTEATPKATAIEIYVATSSDANKVIDSESKFGTIEGATVGMKVWATAEGKLYKVTSVETKNFVNEKSVFDDTTRAVTTAKDGWAISIKDVGVFGNRVTDKGPIYDFYVDNLFDLVAKLNETTKFYTPACEYYKDVACADENKISDPENHKSEIRSVLFKTVYVGQEMMEPLVDGQYWGFDSTGKNKTYWGDTVDISGKKDPNGTNVDIDSTAVGCAYIIPATRDWISGTTGIIDLNSSAYSGFTPPKYYATNQYNSNKEIKVRIRRFNHDCVIRKEVTGDESPYSIISSVIDVNTIGTNETQWYRKKPSADVLSRDFYEFAILDPTISNEVQLYNVGSVSGRGDISVSDLKNMISSMYLSLPDDLFQLNLDYYDYTPTAPSGKTQDESKKYANGQYSQVEYTNVQIQSTNPLLGATSSDILRAFDKIELDERYIVEGLTDLGNTESMIQNYIANIAVNSNYFYAASTTQSVNYMVIANKKSKVVKDSSKIYFLAPYDLDDGTVGYLFNACSSVIYWETVFKNRRNNQEFAAAFGQTHGVTSVVNLAKEFNKTERQLLLTKKINTIFHDLYLDSIYINDNYTNQTEDNVMKEECNERLRIRISKAMPVLLNQFKGQQNTATVRASVVEVINYWFKTVVMNYGSTISDYLVICNDELNPAEEIRANRLNVKVQVRFNSSIKYITVYEEAYPIGIEFGE